jgi:hypothetical protein
MIEQDYMIKWVTGNENVDPKIVANKEQHYRRGYHQGYDQAVHDLLNGASEIKLIEHCEKLYDWRTKEKTGEKLPPFLQSN